MIGQDATPRREGEQNAKQSKRNKRAGLTCALVIHSCASRRELTRTTCDDTARGELVNPLQNVDNPVLVHLRQRLYFGRLTLLAHSL